MNTSLHLHVTCAYHCLPTCINSAWEALVKQSEELACLGTIIKKLVNKGLTSITEKW